MPVGDKNQMLVRVERGYKQITIQTLENPPAKRGPADEISNGMAFWFRAK